MAAPRLLVVDEGPLADQVRALAASLNGDRPVVRSCEDVDDAADLVEREGPFDVVVAGPAAVRASQLAALGALHEEHPTTMLVLAPDRGRRLAARDLVRTGAIDLVPVPAGPDELAEALRRAVRVARRASAEAPERDASGGAGVPTTVVTVASASGGCGKTFLAANLACFFARHLGKRACVIDLDLQFGELATALRLRPRYSISDLLAALHAGEAEVDVEEFLVRHETGLWVLNAPKDPSEADRIPAHEVGRVIELVRERFDLVVIDTPAALNEVVLASFDRSDLLYVVATLDLPSVRNLGMFLQTLERLRIPSDDILLVLNKAERDVGIDVEQVTKLFPQGFSAILPYAREVSRSINLGMPVLAAHPAAEVSARLFAAFTKLVPEGTEPRPLVGQKQKASLRKGRLRWWGGGRRPRTEGREP
jgi:pilus assembly protein CpaE